MSSAFLKNERADDPVVIPARAPLPPGTTNYVTYRGLSLLREELAALEQEHAHTQIHELDETERMRKLALLNGQIGALNQRIATAKVVDNHEQPHHEVRFGATVHLKSQSTKHGKANRQLTIVGVDEADATNGRIAFTAPIARLMLGKSVGDSIALRTIKGENVLKITDISYEG
ncbi:GreA/GreB family elongation factor [Spirosoma pollinicola]|uniref:Transcription elongation factor GreAB n=1 Tax=Spirosoma pollinicola TaxID=2057025 RepID=A0A2K8Z284_9BACT|nr:GreA/GreB family elongation factor [Spirosoma pollinicola]AUD03983.1 transcription elongation factor GreAB [Spirosoma pollinicola]